MLLKLYFVVQTNLLNSFYRLKTSYIAQLRNLNHGPSFTITVGLVSANETNEYNGNKLTNRFQQYCPVVDRDTLPSVVNESEMFTCVT